MVRLINYYLTQKNPWVIKSILILKYIFQKFFREKDGFDVVIANPPYVRQEEITNYKKDLQKFIRFILQGPIYIHIFMRKEQNY